MRSFWLPVWTGLLKHCKDLITYITEVFLQLVNVKNIICAAYAFSKVLEEIQFKVEGMKHHDISLTEFPALQDASCDV